MSAEFIREPNPDWHCVGDAQKVVIFLFSITRTLIPKFQTTLRNFVQVLSDASIYLVSQSHTKVQENSLHPKARNAKVSLYGVVSGKDKRAELQLVEQVVKKTNRLSLTNDMCMYNPLTWAYEPKGQVHISLGHMKDPKVESPTIFSFLLSWRHAWIKCKENWFYSSFAAHYDSTNSFRIFRKMSELPKCILMRMGRSGMWFIIPSSVMVLFSNKCVFVSWFFLFGLRMKRNDALILYMND